MPRQLLRDGIVVEDDWSYAAAATDDSSSPHAPDARQVPGGGIIVAFDQWLADKEVWRADPRRLGAIIQPVHKVEMLAPDLARFNLVAVEFSGPGEGRGYTQGRLLRERYRFEYELRATGYVRRDQLFFLARCGFNSFELPDSELFTARAALATFPAAYQNSNDAGLLGKLTHRFPSS